jgi:hypothetical protein
MSAGDQATPTSVTFGDTAAWSFTLKKFEITPDECEYSKYEIVEITYDDVDKTSSIPKEDLKADLVFDG